MFLYKVIISFVIVLFLPRFAFPQSTGNMQIDSKGIPRAIWNVAEGSYKGTPADIAKQYLKKHSHLFKLKEDLSDIEINTIQLSPAGTHVRLFQKIGNIQVYNSDIVVSVGKNNVVDFVMNNYRHNLKPKNISPKIKSLEAIRIAKNFLGGVGKLVAEPSATLMLYTVNEEAMLAYQVSIPAIEPRGDWEVWVDAISGNVIASADRIVYKQSGKNKYAQPTGYVFDPDPLTTARAIYGSAGFVDNNDSTSAQLDLQRVLVSLKDLKFQDGRYFLEGPYVKITDWDSPYKVVASSADPDSFRFNRFDDGFEDVMVYYHIDSSQRYLQKLGFYNIQNLPIQADPHGVLGDDNSQYWSSLNMLTFGEGGVDDAEDADVIIHEYAHAINYGIIPAWLYSGEQAALAEGFSDYWAASYSRKRGFWTPSDQQFHWVFNWDGNNQFWAGRILNYEPLYPSGLVSDRYKNGQMWSSTLMNIWNDIGAEITDRLAVQSFYYLAASGVTMTTAAQAVIQADRNLHNGVNLPTLIKWFGQRGFISPSNYLPKILHTNRNDSENLSGPYKITTDIIPETAPLDSSLLKIIWGHDGVFTDTTSLSSTGNPNEFFALITGNGSSATYKYYITATDIYNLKAVNPEKAPAQFFTFYVGIDTIKPVISHIKIIDVPKNFFPPQVKAKITDNIVVDSVGLEYYMAPGNRAGSFALERTAADTFAAYFNIDTSFINTGDSVYYRIVAIDSSSKKNTSYLPDTGFFAFRIAGAVDVAEEKSGLPDKFYLSQNYPNPFNPSTVISWQLPVSNWVTLKVYDVLGREVATLLDGYKAAGYYEITFDANLLTSGYASGVYFYKLTALTTTSSPDGQAGSAQAFMSVKKMVLLR